MRGGGPRALARNQRSVHGGSVTDHLGDALCRLAPRHLPSGVTIRDGRIVLVQPVTDYAGLCDAMLHMIRQNAAGSVHVLARMLEVLTRVAEVERQPDRRVELRRHAALVIAAARRDVSEPADLNDLRRDTSASRSWRLPASRREADAWHPSRIAVLSRCLPTASELAPDPCQRMTLTPTRAKSR